MIPWANLAFDTWLLGAEASAVIAMRFARISQGDLGAAMEMQRMISEKGEALFNLQLKAMTGSLGARPETAARRAVKHYRRAVAKNRKRLASR